MTFVKWKFNRMLTVATIVMSVNYVVMLSGSVIVGNLVGAEGLAGVNTCTPVFGVASFLASLISVGSGLVFSRAMGAFDVNRARGVFSQSMILAIGLGAAIYVAMLVGETPFLDLTGVTDAVRLQAEGYWRWQTVAMSLLPSVLTLEALVYADGDGPVALLAGVTHVVGSIGLATFFTWRIGNAGGAALGTAITMLGVLSVCSLHFRRATSHLKFKAGFSAADLRETLAASLADSTIYLCWGVLVFIVNKFAVTKYGQDVLPLVALAASIVEFSIVFDGIGEALIPLGGMYDGERNKPALRELANWSATVAVLEGMACGAAFFLLAPAIAQCYGDFGPAVGRYGDAVGLTRILAFAMPFMALLMMMNTHFLVVHHTPFAVSVTVMKDFVCPCVGALALGSAEESGIWFGFAAGYAVAAAYPFAYVLIRHGRELFPWLIERDGGRSTDFSVTELTDDSLAAAKGRIGEFLNDSNVFETGAMLTAVEMAGRTTIAANARPVRAEYFVSTEDADTVRLIVRDNGRPLESDTGKYLNTLGCNRTEFRFDIIPPV